MIDETKLQDLFKPVQQAGLTIEEKSEARAKLAAFAATYIVREQEFSRLNYQRSSNAWKRFFFRYMRPMPAFGAFLVAVLVGGITSSNAEGSLPGDPLYGVKVGVNEEVRGWFAETPRARAAWEAERAARRLEEVEALAIRGTLDRETEAMLAMNFERYAERASQAIARLAVTEDVMATAEANSHLEAVFRAHKSILSGIGNAKNVTVNIVLGVLETKATAAADARIAAESDITTGLQSSAKAASEEKHMAAERVIKEVRLLLLYNTSFDAREESKLFLQRAENSLRSGSEHMKKNAYGEAFVAFQTAFRIAEEIRLFIAAQGLLKAN